MMVDGYDLPDKCPDDCPGAEGSFEQSMCHKCPVYNASNPGGLGPHYPRKWIPKYADFFKTGKRFELFFL
jgi:hypothetical protein